MDFILKTTWFTGIHFWIQDVGALSKFQLFHGSALSCRWGYSIAGKTALSTSALWTGPFRIKGHKIGRNRKWVACCSYKWNCRFWYIVVIFLIITLLFGMFVYLMDMYCYICCDCILFLCITKTRLFKYWKFYYQKKIENFQIKNSDSFHISAQNIDCGYSLEPPRRCGSNEYQ